MKKIILLLILLITLAGTGYSQTFIAGDTAQFSRMKKFLKKTKGRRLIRNQNQVMFCQLAAPLAGRQDSVIVVSVMPVSTKRTGQSDEKSWTFQISCDSALWVEDESYRIEAQSWCDLLLCEVEKKENE